ncbi:MAG: branched chain amino acid aminotransferase, partial [Myxococcota bacterium]|nr:branched chain amino acid aminotransferase [Myxococcota bacterium]
MTKEDIDWGNLGFDYKPTTYRFVATYKDGAWSEGELI